MDTKNMIIGSPKKIILNFAFPLMLGNIFQQLYTFFDTLIVGKIVGVNALSALGATEWLVFIMNGLVLGLIQGFTVIVAQRFGAAKEQQLKKAIVSAIQLSILLMIILFSLGQIIAFPILKVMRTPSEIIQIAEKYLRIIYAGVPIVISYNLFAAILRAQGDSKTPLYAVVISSVLNIILDISFIKYLCLDIVGAAVATIIAQIISVFICLVKIKRTQIVRLTFKDLLNIDRETCIIELKVGIPMGIQSIITAIGGLIVQTVINGFGVLFIAGFTIANKLYGLLEMAATSYGFTMNTFTGQNFGAKQYKRIAQGIKDAIIIGVITALIMSFIMMIFGRPILGCFINKDDIFKNEIVNIGYHFLIILASFFPLLYILYIIRASIQGLGNSILPMISSFIQLIMRVGCALLLTKYIGNSGVFWGEVLAWIGADIFLIISYYYIKRSLNFNYK